MVESVAPPRRIRPASSTSVAERDGVAVYFALVRSIRTSFKSLPGSRTNSVVDM
jgi:hypothetical protein